MEKLIETQRLLIRPLEKADALLLYRYSQEESARRELPDEVQASPEEALETIKYLQGQYEGDLPWVYGVVRKDTGQLIGHVSLSGIPEGVEIGYVICEACQGRGLGTEAALAFGKWAMDTRKLDSLYAVIQEKNLPSRRVAEKAGFQLVSVEERLFLGEKCRAALYALTNPDRPDNG